MNQPPPDTAWQNLTWTVFHFISLRYNPEQSEHYIRFFKTFQIIIPCKICRTHFNQKISEEGMGIEENILKGNIFNWTILLHNNVNKLNNKKEWSFEQANSFYNKLFYHNFL